MAAAQPSLTVASDERLGRRVALLSVSVSALLAAAKIYVGLRAGSAALVSDGLEATGDVLTAAIVYAGLSLASRPPDREHPYGHGRYETLSALAIGGILLLTGGAIFWHGFTALETHNASLPTYALYPLFAAILIKSTIAALKFRVGRRIASSSLEADGWHDLTDLLSTFVALAAVGLTIANPSRFAMADQVGGMIIGIIVFFLAVQLVRRTLDQLLDTMPEPERMAQIREVALSVPGALGIEKCFARRSGMKYHVDLHLEVDPDMTVRKSHDIATTVRFAVIDRLPWVADVLVHVEPSPLPATAASVHPASRRVHGK